MKINKKDTVWQILFCISTLLFYFFFKTPISKTKKRCREEVRFVVRTARCTNVIRLEHLASTRNSFRENEYDGKMIKD